MRNKKGNIPIAILVVGVILICALAILSFLSSSFKLEKSFADVTIMEDLNVKIEEYTFYKNQGVSNEEIKNALNIFEGYLRMEKGGTYIIYYLGK